MRERKHRAPATTGAATATTRDAAGGAAGGAAACAACPMHSERGLRRLGIDMAGSDFVVALAGNPNTGKSTVFNALTGLRQHTGNWPGKTVQRAEGAFSYNGGRFKVVDLPGTYSLLATSTDEEVARDFILFGRPDVTVIVVDATRLERNLNLVLQVLEITDRAVVCLNLMDEAERNRIHVDERQLARDLGVPVVATAARNGKGIRELLGALDEVARGTRATSPYRLKLESAWVQRALDELVPRIQELYPELPNPRWIALRLLEEDEHIVEGVLSGELGMLNAEPAGNGEASA